MKTTVVHIITRLELGGAQQNTIDTCLHLDRTRFDVALMYGPGGPLDDQAERLPSEDRDIVPSFGRLVDPLQDASALVDLRRRLARRLRRHLEQGRPRSGFIVHTHSSKAGVLGRLAARSLGIENVVHSIHSFGFHEGQHPALQRAFVEAERQCAHWTRAFIAVSRASMAEAQARGLVGTHHLARVIRSGMDLAPFRAAAARRTTARLRLGIAPDTPLFVSVANLKPQKDPLTLVRAFERVARSEPRARLWYVGEGSIRRRVEQEIHWRRLEGRFILLGWRRDVSDLMAAGNVVVLSSIFEGLPRSAVQAVAAERTFVGTRVDGTPEVVRHGRNGWLVEPRRPERLAEAMLRGLHHGPTDPDPDRWLAPWTLEALVTEQEALYDRLTNG
jgi:glycosyltransferase involved in cell wall biosynthesis